MRSLPFYEAAIWFVLVILAPPLPAQKGLDLLPRHPLGPAHYRLYEESLRLLGLEKQNLVPYDPADRDGGEDPGRVSRETRRDPLRLLESVCSGAERAINSFVYQGSFPVMHRFRGRPLLPDTKRPPAVRDAREPAQLLQLLGVVGEPRWRRGGLPPAAEAALLDLVRTGTVALALCREGLAGWGEKEARALVGAMRQGRAQALPRPPVPPDPGGLKRERLLGAAQVVLEAVYQWRLNPPAVDLKSVAAKEEGAPGYEGDLRLVQPTPRGDIVLGGPGRTVYRKQAFLILDVGGDDIYYDAAGAAAPTRPVSIVLDLGGDDLHLAGEGPSQGGALAGVAALVDLGGGRDTYLGKDVCQGAAAAGFGMLYDDGGANTFRAGAFSQGAACWGVGLLFPGVGNDTLEGRGPCQGSAGPAGYALLLDFGGHDLYRARAGGKDPWARCAQGAAAGILRTGWPGGTGMLIDRQGDDHYRTDGAGQGAGFCDGLGALVDLAGRDSYRAGRLAQGAAGYLGLGVLVDAEGDDDYVAKDMAQGAGRRRGTGIFLDRRGNDRCRAGRLAQGVGTHHGCGLLLDLAGDDRREARAGESQGWALPADGWGSVGLFLDFGGKDENSGGLADGGCRPAGRHGLARDMPAPGEQGGRGEGAPSPPSSEGEEESGMPLPRVAPTEKNVAEHFRLALAAEPGSRAWRRHAAVLAGMGEKAAAWLVERVLVNSGRAGPSDTMWRLLVRCTRTCPEKSAALVLGHFEQLPGDFHRLLAIRLLGRIGAAAARPRLEAILAGKGKEAAGLKELFQRTAAAALGRIGVDRWPPAATRLVGSVKAEDRMAAAILLGGTAAAASMEDLLRLAVDGSWMVRDAARDALRRRRIEATTAVAGKLEGAKGWQQLVLVRLLGDLEARAAAPRLLSLLRTDDPVLAWTAARALARCGGPEEIEKGLAALRQQKGHLIAAAIAHLEKQLAK